MSRAFEQGWEWRALASRPLDCVPGRMRLEHSRPGFVTGDVVDFIATSVAHYARVTYAGSGATYWYLLLPKSGAAKPKVQAQVMQESLF